ncbi:unnamed protein product [Arctia plantaginis]|uniref:Carboxylesterase type B domain-containing protein n=1 Tax=Arctia plantaginis TaxID=874455 RepID=A0A8S1B9B7_ARCPL|nr:unnamed protein product [Arctia plantaginis]CAB3256124.1 unnamed protein product [Arctia plantaginis]
MDTHKLSLHICNSIKQYIIDLESVSQTVRTQYEKRNNLKTRLALNLGLQTKLKIVTLLLLLMSQNSNCNGFGSRNSMLRTRVIGTRYGKLQGVILPMDQHKYLKPVEAYLGVPYATPPTGSNRFAPTRAPAPWDDVKTVDQMGPVCPQRLPDISNETLVLERMPKGRLEYLRRLLPRLKNQSEDCLYMNIYTPVQGNDFEL